MKILGSIWFNKIGIVLINDDYENKAYIGYVKGINEKEDTEYISKFGYPFPVKQAEEMIYK
jgi:hypothetical protein